jgi:XTP/dITP diphosphohydrolase
VPELQEIMVPVRLTLLVVSVAKWELAELQGLLAGRPADLIRAEDVVGEGNLPRLEGDSLESIASGRAEAIASLAGFLTLAEAGGLEVAALSGRPGIRSDHFAHERATDAENNAALLNALEEVEADERGACFRSVLALASPWHSQIRLVEGRCSGVIARAARGGGFGYEPLFLVPELGGRALSELNEDEKRRVSARARAARALEPIFIALVNDLLDATERVVR